MAYPSVAIKLNAFCFHNFEGSAYIFRKFFIAVETCVRQIPGSIHLPTFRALFSIASTSTL